MICQGERANSKWSACKWMRSCDTFLSAELEKNKTCFLVSWIATPTSSYRTKPQLQPLIWTGTSVPPRSCRQQTCPVSSGTSTVTTKCLPIGSCPGSSQPSIWRSTADTRPRVDLNVQIREALWEMPATTRYLTSQLKRMKSLQILCSVSVKEMFKRRFSGKNWKSTTIKVRNLQCLEVDQNQRSPSSEKLDKKQRHLSMKVS